MGINFDITKYDTGGWGAVQNDGQLNGEEVLAARRDGWLVFEGYNQKAGTPKNTGMAKFEAKYTDLMYSFSKDHENRLYNDVEQPYTTVNASGERSNSRMFKWF